MLAALTEQDRLRKFRCAHGQDPVSARERDTFIRRLAVGLYNDGWDEWPENDEEVD